MHDDLNGAGSTSPCLCEGESLDEFDDEGLGFVTGCGDLLEFARIGLCYDNYYQSASGN